MEKIKQLEEEKNALLDYIEENVEKSQQNTARQNNSNNSTQNKLFEGEKLKQLELEKSKLYQLTETLKF